MPEDPKLVVFAVADAFRQKEQEENEDFMAKLKAPSKENGDIVRQIQAMKDENERDVKIIRDIIDKQQEEIDELLKQAENVFEPKKEISIIPEKVEGKEMEEKSEQIERLKNVLINPKERHQKINNEQKEIIRQLQAEIKEEKEKKDKNPGEGDELNNLRIGLRKSEKAKIIVIRLINAIVEALNKETEKKYLELEENDTLKEDVVNSIINGITEFLKNVNNLKTRLSEAEEKNKQLERNVRQLTNRVRDESGVHTQGLDRFREDLAQKERELEDAKKGSETNDEQQKEEIRILRGEITKKEEELSGLRALQEQLKISMQREKEEAIVSMDTIKGENMSLRDERDSLITLTQTQGREIKIVEGTLKIKTEDLETLSEARDKNIRDLIAEKNELKERITSLKANTFPPELKKAMQIIYDLSGSAIKTRRDGSNGEQDTFDLEDFVPGKGIDFPDGFEDHAQQMVVDIPKDLKDIDWINPVVGEGGADKK